MPLYVCAPVRGQTSAIFEHKRTRLKRFCDQLYVVVLNGTVNGVCLSFDLFVAS